MAAHAIPRPRWLRYAALVPAVAAAAVARLPGPLSPHAVVLVTAVLILAGALAAQAIGAGSPGAVASFAVAIGLHLAWAAVRAVRLSPALPRDFRRRAEAILAEFIPPRIAAPAAAELEVLRYAIGWRMKPDVPAGARAFAYHRTLRPIFWTLVFVSVMEIGLTHLLVALAAPKAAWLVIALSEFGLVYLLGMGNALARRPILLTDTHLHIRTGLLIEARLPLDRIVAVRQVLDAGDLRRPGFLKASLLAYPNVLVELTEPTAVTVAFKPTRQVTTLGLHPDDAAAFVAALTRR
jgi:hypothetical protein